MALVLSHVTASPVASYGAQQRVELAGVNLFGLSNSSSVFGTAFTTFESPVCEPDYTAGPYLDPPEHFWAYRDLGFNTFRLPIAWQHAQTKLNGPLNETIMSGFDSLIKTITSNGSTAIIDIHNYARYNCAVINQPQSSLPIPSIKVTNAHFNDLWTKLATRYKSNPKVIFELMNEPHDLDIFLWAQTLQEAILAIRKVTHLQRILVSGTSFARLTDWQANSAPGIAPPLLTDPANKLVYDFHQYFDDDAGALGLCRPWSAFASSFAQVTQILRKYNAKAMLTEFGGAPVPQCATLLGESLLPFLEQNRDVWLGWTVWGSWLTGSGTALSTDPKNLAYTLVKVLKSFVPSA